MQIYFLCRVQDHTTIPQNDPLPGLKLRRGAYRPHPRKIDDKRHGIPSLHINGAKENELSTDKDANMDASHNTTAHKPNSRISMEHGRLKQPGVTAHRHGRMKEYIPPKKTSLLPKKIITVFGPESSGTTFIATTLGVALGIFPEKGRRFRVPSTKGGFKRIVEKQVNKRVTSDSGEWEVQHLSLPWGWHCEDPTPAKVVEALVPDECFRYEDLPDFLPLEAEARRYTLERRKRPRRMHHFVDEHGIDDEIDRPHASRRLNDADSSFNDQERVRLLRLCREEVHISQENEQNNGDIEKGWTCGTCVCGRGQYDGYAIYPKRFSVNITSHIEFYLARGVDVVVLLSTRDRTISHNSKFSSHCKIEEVVKDEDEMALALMKQALEKYGRGGSKVKDGKPRAIAVSYEAMIGLKQAYLNNLYVNLGINSTYAPKFEDGNEKYISGKTGGESKSTIGSLVTSAVKSFPPKPLSSPLIQTEEKILPKRIVTVVGPEFSGTSFMSTTLGMAVGALDDVGRWRDNSQGNGKEWDFEDIVEQRAFSPDRTFEIQHITLPWGITSCQANATSSIVNALVPNECFRYEADPGREARVAEQNWANSNLDGMDSHLGIDAVTNQRVAEICRDQVQIDENSVNCGAKCGRGPNNGFALYPQRFSLNITSHIEFYLALGVDIKVVIMTRDPSITRKIKLEKCKEPLHALTENALAYSLTTEALKVYGKAGAKKRNEPERVFVASYESLMAMEKSYLFDVYKQLEIDSNFSPQFKDENERFIGKADQKPHNHNRIDADEGKLEPIFTREGTLRNNRPHHPDAHMIKEISAHSLHQNQHAKKKLPPPPKELPSPKERLLPKKVITVFGPESSGTTFLATTLGVASGAFGTDGGWEYVLAPGKGRNKGPQYKWAHLDNVAKRAMTPDGELEIQHLSLPWGWMCGDPPLADVAIVDALVPDECFRYERDPSLDFHYAESIWFMQHRQKKRLAQARMKRPNTNQHHRALLEVNDRDRVDYPNGKTKYMNKTEVARLQGICRDEVRISGLNEVDSHWTCGAKCGKNEFDGFALYPQRFSVNITAHIEWYLTRGVDISVVLSLRDRSISYKSKFHGHCPLERESRREDAIALNLMKEAIEKYGAKGSRCGSLPGDVSGRQRAFSVSYEGMVGMKEVYLKGLYKQLGIESTYIPSFADGNTKYVGDANQNAGNEGFFSQLQQLWTSTTMPDVKSLDNSPVNVLPKRVISVVGADRSSTLFLSAALAAATGCSHTGGESSQHAVSEDGAFEIQYMPLPWDHSCEVNSALSEVSERNVNDTQILLDSIAPVQCFSPSDVSILQKCKHDASISQEVFEEVSSRQQAEDMVSLLPNRYFVNVTSHIEWYLSRDIDISVVLVMRDTSISKKEWISCGISSTLVDASFEKSMGLMKEAFVAYGMHGSRVPKVGTERVLIVSYEGLMEMKDSYLYEVYNELGIDSTFLPSFIDGNAKYIIDPPPEKH